MLGQLVEFLVQRVLALLVLLVLDNVQVLPGVVRLQLLANSGESFLDLENLVEPCLEIDRVKLAAHFVVVVADDGDEQIEADNIDQERTQDVGNPVLVSHIWRLVLSVVLLVGWILTKHLLPILSGHSHQILWNCVSIRLIVRVGVVLRRFLVEN